VGRHIPDFVSFTQRVAIELVNANESDTIAKDRAARSAWLAERGYRVVEVEAVKVEVDLAGVMEELAGRMGADR
jgi:tRNA/rRNA methyltransferase